MTRIITEQEIPNDDERLAHYLSNPPDSKTRSRAEKQLEDLAVALGGLNYKQLRILAKHDVFFLANAILGYPDLNVSLHGDLSGWMMRNRRTRFRMLLLPRGHYKTTVWTIADSIRIALPDDANLGIWPECLGPECRILIGHEVRDTAASFLVTIAGNFLSNPLLMSLFPECIPTQRKQRISKYELELPRESNEKEPTFATMGVGGRSQGYHFNYLKLDDLIGDKARDSKKEMATAISWMHNIPSFFVDFTRDHLDLAGTRWAPRDLYWDFERMYKGRMIKYQRPAEEVVDQAKPYHPKDNPEVPIFPEKFTSEDLEILKRDPIIWAAQYANNPEAYGREFKEEWKRYYKWIKYGEKLVVLKENNIPDIREIHNPKVMDKCILIDPAMTGNLGMLVTAGSGDKQFILEAIKHPLQPPEFVELLFILVLKWKPRLVAIEEVLFSGLYRPWLIREMQARKIFFNLTMYKVGTVAKEARVRGLSSYFKNQKIYFHESQTNLIEEYDSFSSTSAIDDLHMLDALSAGPHLWMTRAFTSQERQSYKQYEEQFHEEQDAMTGY